MDLTELTVAARCTGCSGTGAVPCPDETKPRGGQIYTTCSVARYGPCPRCLDHPGIDPDVVQFTGGATDYGQGYESHRVVVVPLLISESV